MTGFGVARSPERRADLTLPGAVVGHPRYAAPETFRNQDETPRSDVYALGVILYFALAGRPPFEASSVVELASQHLKAEPPPIGHGCPPALETLVRERLLAKDPSARPEAEEVAKLLFDRALLAPPPPSVPEEPSLPGCVGCAKPVAEPIPGGSLVVCRSCDERAEMLEVCATCFAAVPPAERLGPDCLVRDGRIHCAPCSRRALEAPQRGSTST